MGGMAVKRIIDGRLWESRPEIAELIDAGPAAASATPFEREYWRSGSLTIWREASGWCASHRGRTVGDFDTFAVAARAAAALKETVDGKPSHSRWQETTILVIAVAMLAVVLALSMRAG
jgi:hypothetical protein